jgi:hypothetical protein
VQNLPQSALSLLREDLSDAAFHPNADLLTAFAEQSLDSRERADVIEHLARCGDCRTVLALALPSAETVAPAAVRSGQNLARRSWLGWSTIQTGALAAGLLMIVTWVGVLHYAHRAPKQVAANFASGSLQKGGSGQMTEAAGVAATDVAVSPEAHQELSKHELPAAKGTVNRHSLRSSRKAKATSHDGVPETQIAENQSELPFQGQSFSDMEVVKAKDPVPEESVAAPAGGPLPTSSEASASLPAAVPTQWEVTPSGVLQRSHDSGRTWERVNPEPNLGKAGLFFGALAANGLNVWAGGSAGALYHSVDGGDHWTRATLPSSDATPGGDIISIQFADPQHGEIVSSTGELWTTSDGGRSWLKQ